MTAPTCRTCGRDLLPGDVAFAEDWKVLTGGGFVMETRYICEDCEAKS